MDNLNEGMVARVKLPRPPAHEQEGILKFIEDEVRAVNVIIANTDREITVLREFRTRLVADVVTGKIDVRAPAAALPEITESEPIDEPPDGEDLEEAIDDVENEAVAA